MRTFIRRVVQALILVVVALVSAVTAMRLAIHGRETPVPNLVGKTPIEARRQAEAGGFQFEIERQYYSANIAEGRVLSQVPAPGTLTRSGWQIRVATSLGPQRVEIPNVVGLSERAAEINIRRRGLDVGAVAQIELPDVPAEQIVAQTPAGSSAGATVPNIGLLVAEASRPAAFVMPNFVSQTVAVATAAAQAAGLRVNPPISANTATGPSATGASTGIIVSQSPAPGTRVAVGDAVTFNVN